MTLVINYDDLIINARHQGVCPTNVVCSYLGVFLQKLPRYDTLQKILHNWCQKAVKMFVDP